MKPERRIGESETWEGDRDALYVQRRLQRQTRHLMNGGRIVNQLQAGVRKAIGESAETETRLADPVEHAKTFLRRWGYPNVFNASVYRLPSKYTFVGRMMMTDKEVIEHARRLANGEPGLVVERPYRLPESVKEELVAAAPGKIAQRGLSRSNSVDEYLANVFRYCHAAGITHNEFGERLCGCRDFVQRVSGGSQVLSERRIAATYAFMERNPIGAPASHPAIATAS